MQHRGFLLLALLALLALASAVAKKKDKVKKGGPGGECAEWAWGPLRPQQQGLRRGVPRRRLRGADPARPLPRAVQLEEGVRSRLQVQVRELGIVRWRLRHQGSPGHPEEGAVQRPVPGDHPRDQALHPQDQSQGQSQEREGKGLAARPECQRAPGPCPPSCRPKM